MSYYHPTLLLALIKKDGGGRKAKRRKHRENHTITQGKPFLRASENLKHLNFGSHHWNYNWSHVLTDETKIFLQKGAADRKSTHIRSEI